MGKTRNEPKETIRESEPHRKSVNQKANSTTHKKAVPPNEGQKQERPHMVKSKKSKKRKLNTGGNSMDDAPAYKQDLGYRGINVVNNWDKPKNISAFKVTKKENKRRKLRELRFSAGTPEPTGDDDGLPFLLDSALSSSRGGSGSEGSTSTAAVPSNKKPAGKIVGTSAKLEKSYLRLTTFPNPKDVRPLSILQRALQRIKAKYIRDEEFEYANDQLKAVRQDMTVQGIRSDFCVEVYEMHARILLEHGDLSEFNQCQSMIRTLTEGGAGLEDEPWKADALCQQTPENRDEFQAYQLLYSLVQHSWTDLTKALGGTDTSGHGCQHAVLVVKSVIHNDYRGFFRLYESAPHLSAYLMDFLVKRVRAEAYDRIVASYRPTMCIENFREALQFPNLGEARQFLKANGAVFLQDTEAESWVDCKASHAKQIKKKK